MRYNDKHDIGNLNTYLANPSAVIDHQAVRDVRLSVDIDQARGEPHNVIAIHRGSDGLLGRLVCAYQL